ncbi:MAG: FtsL-like putative cell division protein [Mariniphaga sp.]
MKNNKRKPGMKSFLGGTILTDERFTRQLPFLGLLAFFALALITNRNWSERTIRQIEVVQDTLDELRSESITLSARLMDASRPSEVTERVEDAGLGLEEPVRPPQKIVVPKK